MVGSDAGKVSCRVSFVLHSTRVSAKVEGASAHSNVNAVAKFVGCGCRLVQA